RLWPPVPAAGSQPGRQPAFSRGGFGFPPRSRTKLPSSLLLRGEKSPPAELRPPDPASYVTDHNCKLTLKADAVVGIRYPPMGASAGASLRHVPPGGDGGLLAANAPPRACAEARTTKEGPMGTREQLSHTETASLAAKVVGPVLLPSDAGYETECATFNLMSDVRPAVAVGAASAADVLAAVRFAAARNLPVAVLATGHQMVRSAQGAVLINMSRLNTVSIEADRAVARVQGGVRWRQVLDEADKSVLAPVSGTSPTVGVTGYHLGGGASPIMGRRYGYAAEHVRSLEIVTADGEPRRVTAESEPDLFWALRGGKGNFGVVTALEFRLFPVRTFYGGGLFFAGEHAEKVLHAWREWVAGLPDEISSSVCFLRQPDLPMVPEPLRGRFVLHVRFSSLGSREEAERAIAPVRAIAPTVMDTIRELPYREAGSLFTDPPAP